MSDKPTVITVKRSKLYPAGGRSRRFEWKWTYDYHVDGGPVCQYGPGLADLKAVLKRKFPTARIVETWKEAGL